MENKTTKLNKKGFAVLSKIPIAVLYLVLIGILLVVGVRIMSGVTDEIDTEVGSKSFNNGTATSVNGQTYSYIDVDSISGGGQSTSNFRSCTLAVTRVEDTTTYNGTIESGNYTVSGCQILFSSTFEDDALKYNNTNWNITGSVSYNEDTTEYNASNEAMEGLETVSGYQSLIGLIVVMISIVMLLLGGFSFFFAGAGGR